MKKLIPLCLLLGLTLLGLAGCAGKISIDSRRQIAAAAVSRAETAGAAESDSQDLKLAREKLKLAEQAQGQQRYLKARQLLEQARIDANMAEIKARTGGAMQAAAEIKEEIRGLQQEAGQTLTR